MSDSPLCVIGGGVVGLGIAGELSEDYENVVLLERDSYCYREASYASGGMLAPFMEVEFRERSVLDLNKRSLELYENFVERLRRASGVPLTVESHGSLYLAFDEVQAEELRRLHEYQQRLNLPVRRLTPAQVQQKEPAVADNLHRGLFTPDEKHINNRRLGLALYERCRKQNVSILTDEPVEAMTYGSNGERITEIKTPDTRLQPQKVVVAAGAWSGELPGLRPRDQLPVRPVKGQALSVRLEESFQLETVIRTPDFYGVPHHPERFIVGASMEEKGYDSKTTAGHVLDLLESAGRALPELRNCQMLEHWAGLRPASRDNRPIIGPSKYTHNLYFATANYRNGILQLPATIHGIKQYLTPGEPDSHLEAFRPDRFQSRGNQELVS